MERIWALIFGLILTTIMVTAVFSADDSVIPNWAKERVLLIKQFDRTGKLLQQGAGFFISDDGLFATSYQILGTEPLQTKGVWQSFAQTLRGTRLPIKATLTEDASTGVAVGIVELSPGAKTPYLKLWDFPVTQKIDIWVIGHFLGKEWTPFKGNLTAYRNNFSKGQLQGPFIETTTPAMEGSAGAPILGTQKGNVIGVYLSGEGSLDQAKGTEKQKQSEEPQRKQQELRQLDRASQKNPQTFASASENLLNLKLPNGTTIRENVQQLYLADALEKYKQSIAAAKTDRDRAAATNQLGVALLDHGRTRAGSLDEAAQFFKTASEFDPSFVWPHRNLAVVYFRQKNKPAYLSELSIVEKLDPKLADNVKSWWPSAFTSN